MFIDQVTIDVTAGNGGSGMTAFRREKFVPKGGPSGGDGGRGGSVFVVGDRNLWTLLDYTYKRRWTADNGQPGGPSQQSGKSADDLLMPVPLGTVVKDVGTGEVVGEITTEGERILVAQGGRGGLGNQHFATPTRQAPHHYQPGEDGQQRRVELTLKLIADVGLLGEPNAGKSTLLASLTAARPKIADYPFTTLEPNLGVVQLSDSRSFVIADIPGIIEGAHAGKGLGLRFLRHVERTRVLLHVVDASGTSGRDPVEDLGLVREEVRRWDASLLDRPQLVAATKRDARGDPDPLPDLQRAARRLGIDVLPVSAVTGEGLVELKRALLGQVVTSREAAAVAVERL